MTAVPQIANLEDAATIRGDLNALFRKNSQFADLKYDGSLDPATDCAASLTTLWNAAVTQWQADVAAGKVEALIDFYFGPGTVNLSGLATPLAIPANAKVRVWALQTRFVLATWANSGKSTYGSTARYLFSAGAGHDFIFRGAGAVIYGGGFMDMPSAYSNAAWSVWPTSFPRTEVHGLAAVKTTLQLLHFTESSTAATTNANKLAFTTITSNVVGDGTTKTVQIDAPTAPFVIGNFYAGQRVFFDRASGADNSWRYWEARIASVNTGTNVLTLTTAVPTGITLLGGGRCVAFEKALFHFDRIFIKDIDWEFVPSANSQARLCYFGDTVPMSCLYSGAHHVRVKYGQRFALQFGSTASGTGEFFWQMTDVMDFLSEDYVHGDYTSGGIGLFSSMHMLSVDGFKVRGDLALNDIDLTLSADVSAGQQWVQVSDDLTQVTKKAGFTVTAGEPGKTDLRTVNLGLQSSVTTTANGAVASGVTLVVANAASFSIGHVVSVLMGANLRYRAIVGKSSNTLTLDEAVDATIADGATVTRVIANNVTPGNVGASPTTYLLLMLTIDGALPQGEIIWASVVAIDTARGVGQHRIYFLAADSGDAGTTLGPLPGFMPSGRVIQARDVNAVADNGDESFYSKAHNKDLRGIDIEGRPCYQGQAAYKSGETDKNPLHGGSSGGKSKTDGITLTYGHKGPVDISKTQIGVWVQESRVNIRGVTFDHATSTLFVHDGTPTRENCFRDFLSADALSSRLGGGHYYLANAGGGDLVCENLGTDWHPYSPSFRDGYVFHLKSSGVVYSADYEQILIDHCWTDSSRHYLDGSYSGHRAHLLFRNDHNLATSLYALRKVQIDGWQGRGAFFGALKFAGGGRIGDVALGPKFDIGDFTRAKSELICLGTGSSLSTANNTTPPARLSSTLASGASAGDAQIEINHAHSQKIPKGSHVTVTKNSGSFSTWTTEEGGSDGILKLEDPIDGAANSGNAVTIRPVGEIEVDPLARSRLGLRYSKVVKVASGQGSYTLDIAGKFPCYLHSPGGPRPEKCFIRTRTGDIIAAKAAVTPNNTSQAGGQIVFTFYDPASLSTENLGSDTVAEVGYDESVIRFNQ